MKDLWGNEVVYAEPVMSDGKRKPTRPNGYPAQGGTS